MLINPILKRHQEDVQAIRETLFYWQHNNQGLTNSLRLSLRPDAHYSNTIRENSYKLGRPQLGIEKLNKVISIDSERAVALVEPRVTMKELVQATLPYGFIPAVVPEFKGITVGGAINGAALESSSHLYGQFNDTCLSYDVLLGDGSIVHATPNENADLFYGISGSYGTLGVLLAVEIRLVPVNKEVLVSYYSFSNLSQAIDFMVHCHEEKCDFLEAIVYNHQHIVVIKGSLQMGSKRIHQGKPVSLGKSWSPFFYQHVKDISSQKSFTEIHQEVFSIPDYLFRHDRGAFWMGGYALHPSLLLYFLLDKTEISATWLQKKISEHPERYCYPKFPGRLFRSLFGWIMGSETLYGMLHKGSERWFENRFVIQDFYLPEKKTAEFVNHVLKEPAIAPLWLCPIKSTSTPQHMAPHFLAGKEELLFDVGVYGLPETGEAASTITQKLEQLTRSLGGRKMLYSYSYYSDEEFWQIYSRQDYHALRQHYHADSVWLDITEKVLHGSQKP